MSGYPRQPLTDVQCGRILMDAKPTFVKAISEIPEVRCKWGENVATALERAIERLMCSDLTPPYKAAGEWTRYGGKPKGLKARWDR